MAFTLHSEAFTQGKMAGKYGKENPDQLNGIPQLSFPITWEDVPEGTKSFAITFIDYDNVIGEGFIWIHWLAANIPATAKGIPEDAARSYKEMIQGKNTWAFQLGVDEPVCNRYGGPSPEDRPHVYDLCVYALSEMLDLQNGYYYNEFRDEARGKILAKAELRGLYNN